MQLISEFKEFMDYASLNRLSSGQIALWVALLHINNRCAWIEWFTASNPTLQGFSGLSRTGIYKARNALKQAGIIDFKDTGGGKAPKYKLITLSKSGQSSEHFGGRCGGQSNEYFGALLNRQDKDNANNTARASQLVDCDFQKVVKAYSENISTVLTPVITESLQVGIDDTCTDAVLYAIEQAAISDKRNMGYINAILRGLKNAGVKDKLGLETYRKAWQKNEGQSDGRPQTGKLVNPALQYEQRDTEYALSQLFDNMRGEGK